jgi:hypothetical protein
VDDEAGAVPFRMRFNMGTDYVKLEHYLSTAERYVQRAFQSLPPRHPMLPPLTVDDIELFVDGHTAEYGRLWR